AGQGARREVVGARAVAGAVAAAPVAGCRRAAGPARGRALTLAGCPVVAVALGLSVARRPVAVVAATRGLPIAGCPVVTAIAGALAVGGCQDPVGALGRPLAAQRAAVDRDGDGELGAVGQRPPAALRPGAGRSGNGR